MSALIDVHKSSANVRKGIDLLSSTYAYFYAKKGEKDRTKNKTHQSFCEKLHRICLQKQRGKGEGGGGRGESNIKLQ